MPAAGQTEGRSSPVQLGAAIRRAREARGLSLRELARRTDVSASFVSQVELGKANPSVGTLYTLVSELGASLDELLGDGVGGVDGPEAVAAAVPTKEPAGSVVPMPRWPSIETPVQPASGRKRVEMSGVVWERLTHDHDPYVDFLQVEYAPGSASCSDDDLMRHGGREYGHVLEGRLDVQVGFETYHLGPGDSVHFDSSTPHRLSNPHDVPCRAVWMVLARTGDDRRPGD